MDSPFNAQQTDCASVLNRLGFLSSQLPLFSLQSSRLADHKRAKGICGKGKALVQFLCDNVICASKAERHLFFQHLCDWSPRIVQIAAWKYRGLITQGAHKAWKALAPTATNAEDLLALAKSRPLAPVRIIVIGTGGIGDALQIMVLVRALKQKIPAAHIVLLHTQKLVGIIAGGNTDIASVGHFPWWAANRFADTALAENAADLIVFFRYTVSYRPSAALAQRQSEFLGVDFFKKAAQINTEWDYYLTRFPHFINMMGRKADQKGLSLMGLMGHTSGLAIDDTSKIPFYLTEADYQKASSVIDGRPYVTVHHGAQKSMMAHVPTRRITKMLSLAQWNEIARELIAAGYRLVQVGDAWEDKIDGVEVDLRGRMTLHETAAVLKNAQVHVDTEGGLVHLARAVETRSVVLCGPTTSSFFGYKENINLDSALCSNCYWLTADWYARCPRGLSDVPCMDSHKAAPIIKAVKSLSPSATDR